MQRPAHVLTSDAVSGLTQRRLYGLGFVALVHIAIIWAFVSGLALQLIRHVPNDIEATVVQTPETHQPPIAVPKPTLVVPPQEPSVAPPDIVISTNQSPPITVAQAQPAPGSTSSNGITSTHTTPPYPPMARRLGQQGTVVLQLAISPAGDVTNAQVVKSSGVPELDSTAASWVVAHWKYKPAVVNGVAVASTTKAAVRFDLKHAR